MQAYIVLALALAVPALASARDRFGYDREINTSRLNQVPQLIGFILNDDYLAAQKNRAKLITRPLPEESIVADNVILESNILKVLKPSRKDLANESEKELVRRRRGYNLENVRVPARYPYLPVPNYNRFRRWG